MHLLEPPAGEGQLLLQPYSFLPPPGLRSLITLPAQKALPLCLIPLLSPALPSPSLDLTPIHSSFLVRPPAAFISSLLPPQLFVFSFSKQGFSVVLKPVLELSLVDLAGLELTEIRLPLPPSAGIKDVRHQRLALPSFFTFLLSCVLAKLVFPS